MRYLEMRITENPSATRLGEWWETKPRALRLIIAGIVIVLLSTIVVGVRNHLNGASAASRH